MEQAYAGITAPIPSNIAGIPGHATAGELALYEEGLPEPVPLEHMKVGGPVPGQFEPATIMEMAPTPALIPTERTIAPTPESGVVPKK